MRPDCWRCAGDDTFAERVAYMNSVKRMDDAIINLLALVFWGGMGLIACGVIYMLCC